MEGLSSRAHEILVGKAAGWLKSEGYHRISTGYRIKIEGKLYIIDVVGLDWEKPKIAIECGKVWDKKKIGKLQANFDRVERFRYTARINPRRLRGMGTRVKITFSEPSGTIQDLFDFNSLAKAVGEPFRRVELPFTLNVTKIFSNGKTSIPSEIRKRWGLTDGGRIVWLEDDSGRIWVRSSKPWGNTKLKSDSNPLKS